MLQNINISNLDNSISQTSYYSDAYENSVQLEEHFQKINDQNQASKPNKNSNDKNNFFDIYAGLKIYELINLYYFFQKLNL